MQGKGMGGGGYDNCLPHQGEKKASPFPFSHRDTYTSCLVSKTNIGEVQEVTSKLEAATEQRRVLMRGRQQQKGFRRAPFFTRCPLLHYILDSPPGGPNDAL